MVIKLFVSRTSGNVVMKGEQDYIKRILECKQIDYEEIDVADPMKAEEKKLMQETLKSQQLKMQQQQQQQQLQEQLEQEKMKKDAESEGTALPPQLFNDESYRGDFGGFFQAVETETMFKYLALQAPTNEVEYLRSVDATPQEVQPQPQ